MQGKHACDNHGMKTSRYRVTRAFELSWLHSRTSWLADGCCGVCGLKTGHPGCTCSQGDKQWVLDEVKRQRDKHGL